MRSEVGGAAEKALLAYQAKAANQVQTVKAESVKAESTSSTRGALLVIGVVLLVGVVAVLAGSIPIVRGVRRPVSILVSEAGRIEQAVAHGQVDVRADPREAGSEFRPGIDGINRTADAYLAPLRPTAAAAERIARGDIPERVEGEYLGEFAAIVDSLNRCVAAVRALVTEASDFAQAGVEGRLSVRANLEHHQEGQQEEGTAAVG